MNDKLRFIFQRRSIRKYKRNKAIPAELVNDLMEAAMAAPSAVNKKPYEFIVIDNKDILNSVVDYLPNGKFLTEASIGIIVCGDINKAHTEDIGYLLQDCSAAIENILLASQELGLCSCWLGVYPREDRVNGIKKLFSLPEHIIPVSVISVGFPDGDLPLPRTQYDLTKIHKNSW